MTVPHLRPASATPMLLSSNAVTRGIARPNYSDLVPFLNGQVCAACNHDFTNLSAGNPNLHAQHAWNYDILYANYFTPTSVFGRTCSTSRFRISSTPASSAHPRRKDEFDGYYGTQPQNGGDAHLTGLEMDYSDRFRFLPDAWSGLGFDVNWDARRFEGQHPRRHREQRRRTRQADRGPGGSALPVRRPTSATWRSPTTTPSSRPAPPGSTRAPTSRATATGPPPRTATIISTRIPRSTRR